MSSDCNNICPKLGRAITRRFQTFFRFVSRRPEFHVDKDGVVTCSKLLSFADQLGLLLLADLVRDVNLLSELQEHVAQVASPELRQWLEQNHKGSVVAYAEGRPDLFVMRDGRLFETDELVAPADLEGAVAEAIAQKLAARGSPDRVQSLGASFANEVRKGGTLLSSLPTRVPESHVGCSSQGQVRHLDEDAAADESERV